MNKEQIIKRMNPIQLAKLTGPKTEVADNIKQYPLTPNEMEVAGTPTFNLVLEVLTRPDYGGVPAEMEETTPSLYRAIVEDIPYEERKVFGSEILVNDVFSIDVGDLPEGTDFDEWITQKLTEEKLRREKAGLTIPDSWKDIDTSPTKQPEWKITKVGDVSVTYLDAPPIGVGPATAGFVQVVGDDTPIPEVTYTSATTNGAAISLPRTKKKKRKR